jgi:predicted XRE-type DNA-binding protein
MSKIPSEKSSGNVFADIGFTPAEAAELAAKSSLIIAIKDTIEHRKLTQQEAARLCATDQPTLSKVFRGRMNSVTIDRLASWLNALGRDVEIIVKPSPRRRRQGRLRLRPETQRGPSDRGRQVGGRREEILPPAHKQGRRKIR